jgi:hypothetical protein
MLSREISDHSYVLHLSSLSAQHQFSTRLFSRMITSLILEAIHEGEETNYRTVVTSYIT